jgi:two-component system nitrogen regulation response regulator GlnG
MTDHGERAIPRRDFGPEPSAHGPSGRTASDRTVLIIDDEASLRRVLERALQREGYRVLSTGSAEGACSLLQSEMIDAVLLDIQLPTMSGLALYLTIVHEWPAFEGRVAIMTGDADAAEVRAWLEQHRCTLLRKPFDLREISHWLFDLWQIRERETGNA